MNRGRIYRGDRRGPSPAVYANGRPLLVPPELLTEPDHRYDWGRPSEGCQWLALALIADATQSAAIAAKWGLAFTVDVVERLPGDHFELTTTDVLAWLLKQYHAAERAEVRREA